jgi:hypothetical protein
MKYSVTIILIFLTLFAKGQNFTTVFEVSSGDTINNVENKRSAFQV